MSTNMESVFRIGKQASVLPAGYTQLEYIESTGTQYIDTGVNGSSGVSCNAKVSWVNLQGDRGILGARKTSSDRIMLIHQYTGGHWCLSYGATNMQDLGSITAETVYNVEAKLSNGEQYLKVDGVTLVDRTISGDITNDFNLILFGCNRDDSPAYLSKSRVYDCKISTNNTLVRNFIPAKRNSDNAIGMYDLVTNTFHTNIGTGSFTAGPVVEVCKISQNNQTIWERAISLESDKDSEVTFRSTRNESKNLFDKTQGTIQGYPTTSYTWNTGGYERSIVIKLEEGKTYTVVRASGSNSIFRIQASATYPLVSGQALQNIDSTGTEIITTKTITVPTGYPYVVFYVSNVSPYTEELEKAICDAFILVKGSTAPTSYQPYWKTLPELNAYGNTAQPSAIKPYVKTAISTTPTTFNSELAGPLNVLADGKTEQRNLPAEYQELEYISSDSKAYIDTGIAGGKTTLEIGAKFSYSSFVSYGAIYGNYVSDHHQGERCILANYSGSIIVNNETTCTTTGNTQLSCSINDVHTLISKNTEVTLDGVTTVITNKAQGTENSGNIALLNRSITNPNTSRDIDAKVYEFYIKDNGILVCNLIPAKRLSDSVIGMYDTVTGQFFTNAGTDSFTAGPEKTPTPDAPMDLVSNNGVIKYGYKDVDWNLPADYDRLDYIESTGTQYIIIPHKLDSTEDVNVKYMITSINTDEVANVPFGVTSQALVSNAKKGCVRTLEGKSIFNRVGYGDGEGTVYERISGYKDLNTWYEVEYKSNGECYINGNLITTLPTSTWTAEYDFALFGRMTAGSVTFKIIGRIASCKIGNSVNLVPAKRNSDSAIGMYDLVSQTFFTNQGTGDFTAGNVIQREIYTEGTQEKILTTNNCGVVDMGTLNWIYQTDGTYPVFRATISGPLVASGNAPIYTTRFDMYPTVITATYLKTNMLENTIAYQASSQTNQLMVQCSKYTTAASFKQAMSGVYLYYQRTTDETWNAPVISSVEMLNKVGDYTDIQNVVTGGITKNVGIKVLDGTESWSVTTTNVLQADVLQGNAYGQTCICSHLEYTTSATFSNMPNNSFKNGSATYQNRFFVKSSILATDATTWKAYLASEYAKGTPVIIMYPLATSTTSTVTAQPITQHVGTNIASISEGSLTSLVGEVSGINQTQTAPTPESPLDIVSNNGAIRYGVKKNLVDFNETRITSSTWATADKTKGFEIVADIYSKVIGNSLGSNGNCFGVFVPCKKGESVSLDFFNYAPYYGRCFYCEVDSNFKVLTTPVQYSNGSSAITQKTFTATNDNCIGFAIEWYISASQTRDYTKENYMVVKGTTPPTSYEPYFFGLHTEGTQEKITVSGKNLFDKNEENVVVAGFVTSAGEYSGIASSITDYTKQKTFSSIMYPIKGGKTYTITRGSFRTSADFRVLFTTGKPNVAENIVGSDVSGGSSTAYKTVNVPENATYLVIYIMHTGDDTYTIQDRLDVMQIEEGSTATSYEPYHAPQSVLATMLNKINNYQDIQNIVNGSVTKGIEILVLDGTEGWNKSGASTATNFIAMLGLGGKDMVSVSAPILSTHYQSGGSIGFYTSNPTTLFIRLGTTFNDVNGWKAYLASEYAKGTPVIVLYPLATPATESVAAQDIDINKGTYTAEVTEASLADLDISVKYLGNE